MKVKVAQGFGGYQLMGKDNKVITFPSEGEVFNLDHPSINELLSRGRVTLADEPQIEKREVEIIEVKQPVDSGVVEPNSTAEDVEKDRTVWKSKPSKKKARGNK